MSERKLDSGRSNTIPLERAGNPNFPRLRSTSNRSKFRLNYVGMVASENRWTATKKDLEELRVSREFIESVHSPAGLEINSILLEEIAISILAEIIELRRKEANYNKDDLKDYKLTEAFKQISK